MFSTVSESGANKSVIIAYICWLFGGIFGLHHFYLRRDRHAFVFWSTFGLFCIGWLSEIFSLPKYVRSANKDPRYVQSQVARMSKTRKPPFSIDRFMTMLVVGYTWGQLILLAIPSDEFYGLNLRYLNILVPLATALGVWTVGNIGSKKGRLLWPLIGAYLAYPTRFYIFDDFTWASLVVLVSALAFESFSKEWRRQPKKKHGFVRRVAVLGLCASIYFSLWCSYLYFHGTITDSEGDEVPVYEALHHFFTSPWWVDLKQSLHELYLYAQHHGWYEVWKQIMDLMDPHGEQNAYKVLNLGPNASQQEITSTWRRLSREHHPDKVKEESLRRAAQEKFMEIQQAYEILSNSKHRRQRKNKKDNSERDL